MRNYIGYIIDYADGNLSESKRKWFEYEMYRNKSLMDKYELFIRVNNSMRGRFDLVEVENDPELSKTNLYTSQMVLEFKKGNNMDRYDFISNSLLSIDNIPEFQSNKDSSEAELNKTTKQWVEEWSNNDQSKDIRTKERRSFISSALDENEHQKSTNTKQKSFNLRIIGYAAAALIAIFLVTKSLTPSDTTDRLYNEFYKPLNAYSNITRSGNEQKDAFTDAVEKYKHGDYQYAGNLFNNLVSKNQNVNKYIFFSGITHLQLGNYQMAISQLNQVILSNDDFTKDAQWYLGLAYLKLGDKENAQLHFKTLAETKGYYQKQAHDLLERIK